MKLFKVSIMLIILVAIWGCAPAGRNIPEPSPAADSSPEAAEPPSTPHKDTPTPETPSTPSQGEDPAIVRLLLKEGKDLSSQEKFNEAIDRFNQVIIDDPRMVEAYVAKARAYEGLEEFDEAMTAYEDGLKQAPEGSGEFDRDGIRHHMAMVLYKKWLHTGNRADKKTAREYIDKITVSGTRGNPDLIKLWQEME